MTEKEFQQVIQIIPAGFCQKRASVLGTQLSLIFLQVGAASYLSFQLNMPNLQFLSGWHELQISDLKAIKAIGKFKKLYDPLRASYKRASDTTLI